MEEGVDWIYLAQETEPVKGSCELSNVPSGFIKCWEFLEWLSNCWLLKEDTAPRS
jgi:hypothetical protein